MRVAVIGSTNMDIVTKVHKHPLPGETIHGMETAYSPGGKGANQAVAAAKAGAFVAMIGAVGRDAFAAELRQALASQGIDVANLRTKQTSSGIAFITVDVHGENVIILSAGANNELLPEDVSQAEKTIKSCDVVLLQNEIRWDTTVHAMKLANQYGVKVILNPAPARKIEREVLERVDILVMNETETESIFGEPVVGAQDAQAVGQNIVRSGVHSVIITLGSKGSVYTDETQSIFTPAFAVNVVDTTAAGDTFIGAFAAADINKSGIEAALRFATAASAISVTHQGAQSSIPSRQDILTWLEGTLAHGNH